MKLLLILAVVLGAGALIGTRKDTPFLRWGIVITLAGVALMSASAFFAIRSIWFGIILALAGVAAYYYGRLVRRESLFLTKSK